MLMPYRRSIVPGSWKVPIPDHDFPMRRSIEDDADALSRILHTVLVAR